MRYGIRVKAGVEDNARAVSFTLKLSDLKVDIDGVWILLLGNRGDQIVPIQQASLMADLFFGSGISKSFRLYKRVLCVNITPLIVLSPESDRESVVCPYLHACCGSEIRA